MREPGGSSDPGRGSQRGGGARRSNSRSRKRLESNWGVDCGVELGSRQAGPPGSTQTEEMTCRLGAGPGSGHGLAEAPLLQNGGTLSGAAPTDVQRPLFYGRGGPLSGFRDASARLLTSSRGLPCGPDFVVLLSSAGCPLLDSLASS